MKLKTKGNALAMATTIVLVSTALIVGVWIFTSVQNAVVLPTYTVVNNMTFVNDTMTAVPHPYINALVSVVNSTGNTHPMNDAKTRCNVNSTSTVSCLYNATYIADTNPSIVTYTYNPSGGNTTLNSVISTTWSSFQLGVVVLIVIAAVAIIGILVAGFGRSAGE